MQFFTVIPAWRPGGLPGWVVAVGAAMVVGAVVQIAAGYQRNLGVHVPLGVTLAAAGLSVRSGLVADPVGAGAATMRLSRRDFLGLAGGVGLVAATASLGLVKLGPSTSTGVEVTSEVPLPQPFSRQLTVPPIARPVAGTDTYRLMQRRATVDIIPGLPTEIWGFDGRFPGPTILARSGRPVTVQVRTG